LPSPDLVEGDRFAPRWFRNPHDADRLLVVADAGAGDAPRSWSRMRLNAERMRDLLVQLRALDPEGTVVDARRQALRAELAGLFADSGIEVLIVVPADFRRNLDAWREGLANRNAAERNDFLRPVILHNSADEKSFIAHARVAEVLQAWERAFLKEELRAAGLPDSLPAPINPTEIDLAAKEQLSANLWSKLFPALLVIMALTGAFYPAIDLCAGEKERGTMETLLICPASRTEIVLGKFLTVMLFSTTTALLNLTSLGFTGKYMVSLAGGGPMSKLGDASLPPLSALVWVLVMLAPLSALFSALCLAFATFARSSKEGQYYLTPLLMVTMGLTVFCMSPAVELQPFYSVMPVVGPTLLLKGLLKGQDPGGELILYAFPVLVTSLGYSVLALWWAIDQFAGEEVLFREAERFDLRLWIRHLLRDKEPTPTFGEAVFCFVLIMLLQFAALKVMQAPLRDAAPAARNVLMLQLLIIQQLAIIATPALFMGVLLVADLRKTYLIHWPGWGRLAAGGLLGLSLQPLSLALNGALAWFFPPLPKDLAEKIAAMTTGDVPLWLTLLAFAAAPALCEEIAFRGFLLSGFRRSGRHALAIVLSSLLFGIMHLIPQQVFNAALVGLVLGYVAVRTESLLPGIAFHFCYNASEVIRYRYGARFPAGGVGKLFFSVDQEGLRYEPLLLVLCAIVATTLLLSLRMGRGSNEPPLDSATSLLTPRSISQA
jgi:sodium transport system permease protein